MDGRARRIVTEHPVLAVVALLGLAVALWWVTSYAIGWAGFAVFAGRVRAEEAASHSASVVGPRTASATLTFPFRGRDRTLLVPLSTARLAAERALPTEAVFNSDPWLREAYVRELVRHEADGPEVAALTAQLARLAARLGLDRDGYVELMTRAVQSVPYGTPAWRVEPPASMLAEGRGVCTDKSVLLASLLRHEGYDTVVWTFVREHHVAVGVRGIGPGFRGSGYAFLETTRRCLVGDAGEFLVPAPGSWEPQRIAVSAGSRYTSDVESEFVNEAGLRTRGLSRRLSAYRGYARKAAEPWRSCYAALAAEHDATTALARRIDAGMDYHERTYEMLTRSGSAR